MEKYEKAQMEVIEFEAEDVITTSGGEIGGWGCGTDKPGCSSYCSELSIGKLQKGADRFGGLPYPIFLALQRALT